MGLQNDDGNKVHHPAANKSQDHPSVTGSPSNEPMDILRCAPMSLLQLYIPMEAAQATVAELGSIGLVQFRDVNYTGDSLCSYSNLSNFLCCS